ncbi:hypothetical protein, partial [Inquilinus limosus]
MIMDAEGTARRSLGVRLAAAIARGWPDYRRAAGGWTPPAIRPQVVCGDLGRRPRPAAARLSPAGSTCWRP